MFFGWLDLKQFEIRGSARKSRVQSSANNMHGNCFFFFWGGGGGVVIFGPGMGWFFLEALDLLWEFCRIFIPIRSFPSLEIRSTPLGVEIVVV